MKILILTQPYNGANNLATALCTDFGYKHIMDPMDHLVPLTQTVPSLGEDMGVVYTTYDIPKGSTPALNDFGYNYPDEIEDNTICVHNVTWHKLPGGITEDAFLADFMPKFDKVLIIRTSDVDWNWKKHCAALAQYDNNNYWWKRFNLVHDVHEYEDEMYNVDIYNKHYHAHNYLTNFTIDNPNLKSVPTSELYGHWDKEVGGDYFVDLGNYLGLPINRFDVDGNNDVIHTGLWHNVINASWKEKSRW